MNSWLRLYAEFATDAKVQMLSEADQRRLVMLFCIRCSNGDVTLQDESVTFQLRVTPEEWQRSKALFVARGFIDSDNNLVNWNKRQFVSDSSAARVARHREKQKQACNVTVTAPDTETDTDNRKSKSQDIGQPRSRFAEFWTAYPSKVARKTSHAKWVAKALDAKADQIIADVEQRKQHDRRWLDGFIPNPLTYLTQERWNDGVARGPPIQPQRASAQLDGLQTLEAMKHGKPTSPVVPRSDSLRLTAVVVPES